MVPARRRGPWRGVILFIIAAAMGGGGVFAYLQWRSQTAGSDLIEKTRQIQDMQREMELADVAAKQREKVALAKARLQALSDQFQGVLLLVTECESELKAWDANVTALLTSDRGKVLAGDPASLTVFRSIYNQRRPGKAELQAIRTRIELLFDPIRAALAAQNTSYTPEPGLTGAIEAERQALLGFIQTYHEPRLRVEAMVEAASRANAPATVTLETALKNLLTKETDEQIKAIYAAEEDARKKGDTEIAAARAAKVQQEKENQRKQIEAEKKAEEERGKIKVAQVQAETRAQQILAQTQAASTVDDADRQRKIKLCQSDEVKQLLAPFLAEGYYQPGSTNLEATKRPMSLSRLQGYGALASTHQGLIRLVMAATWKGDRVRPRWPYTHNINSLKPDAMEQINKAQQYLRELGPTMVELKMLSE